MTNNNVALLPFESAIEDDWPSQDWCSVSTLVAVSGGPDSVALLRALAKIRQSIHRPVGTLHVAHFNHGWRAAESDEDEQFVQQLSEHVGLPFHVGHAARASRGTGKTEESARSERYEFLKATAERLGARYLALAHNANDQAETILHRILRGTALRGLAGIPRIRALGPATTICRPMLWASRDDVLGYLGKIHQSYRLDDSNHDTSYTRNRIRHDLLPLLERDYNPRILQSLLKLGRVAEEASQYVEHEALLRMSTCVLKQNNTGLELCRPSTLRIPLHLRKQMLIAAWRQQRWPEQAMGFDQWEQLIQAIDSAATVCLPGNIRVTTTSDVIRLTRFDS